jgi:hypothetical protein
MSSVESGSSEEATAVEEHEGLICRFGSFMLLVGEDRQPEDVLRGIADALDEDARVTDLLVPKLRKRGVHRPGVYRVEASPEAMLADDDVARALRFSAPLRFKVHAPAKNQPIFDDKIPSEDYFVAWDGYSIVVGWTQQTPAPWRHQAGGHVVADVLERAARSARGELYIQACDPWCDHLFAHMTLRLMEDAAAADFAFARGSDWGLVDVNAPVKTEPEELNFALFSRLRLALEAFTNMKNTARRVLDLEEVVREDATRLMQLQLRRAEARIGGPWQRVRSAWGLKMWRSQSRVLLARLWLGLGTLEGLRRIWSNESVDFELETDGNATESVSVLFEVDEKNDAVAVRSLDMSLVRSSLEEASGRLNAGSLTLATLSAGAFGIAGIVIGRFL